MATWAVADSLFLHHRTGRHPESADRLFGIYRHLIARGDLPAAPGQPSRLRVVPLRAATDEELARVHDLALVRRVEQICAAGGGSLDADTVVSDRSAEVARFAAGSAIAMAEATLADPGPAAALALIRPPGHHATPARAMGFCLYNTVALVARHLQTVHRVGRVLIVDWDVHHGNGTQDAFYEDDSVVFLSIHRHPFYPGTGRATERGRGAGEGTTINVPIAAGTPVQEYHRRFAEALTDAATRFEPELVLFSAGFDAYARDPIGGLDLEREDFAVLTDRLAEVAAHTSRRKLIGVLEGGYHLDALPELVAACVDRLVVFGH